MDLSSISGQVQTHYNRQEPFRILAQVEPCDLTLKYTTADIFYHPKATIWVQYKLQMYHPEIEDLDNSRHNPELFCRFPFTIF